ncbi:MAG: metallophosphoesterase [Mycobacteriales bacterium]
MLTPFGELPDHVARQMGMQEQHDWLTRRVSRRNVLSGTVLGASGLAVPAFWRQGSATRDPGLRGRHITFGADPTTSMIVEFATMEPFRRATVEMHKAGETIASSLVEVGTVRGSARRYCRATFAGLRPDTAYRYHVVVDGRTVGTGPARTAFTDRRPFRFTAFGDQGTGHVPRGILSRARALDPLLHLMCGDLCYADSSGLGGPGDTFRPRLWDAWLLQNEPVAGRIPWMSVPGNHEMEPGFGMHGYAGFLTRVSPGGASPLQIPVATTFRVGSVGFIGLDSNDVSFEIPANRGWTRGAQTRWLEQTLSGLRQPNSGIDFIVAFMHHSPYSTNNTHASEGGVLEEWVPLFDRYSVDLVISGHNHCYERARPLRGGSVVGSGVDQIDSARGTTYITAGGGGAGGEARFIPYPGKTRVAYAGVEDVVTQEWSMPSKTATPSVLSVDVKPATSSSAAQLEIRALAADGRQLDAVRLTRGRPVSGSVGSDGWLIGGAAAAALLGGAGAGAVVLRRRRSSAVPPGAEAGTAAGSS